ncbi:MAG: hypothetical protein LC644_10395 [Pseudonocardia sp.]|nr:hypothetical protein [Pseudonocardia sp.]
MTTAQHPYLRQVLHHARRIGHHIFTPIEVLDSGIQRSGMRVTRLIGVSGRSETATVLILQIELAIR